MREAAEVSDAARGLSNWLIVVRGLLRMRRVRVRVMGKILKSCRCQYIHLHHRYYQSFNQSNQSLPKDWIGCLCKSLRDWIGCSMQSNKKLQFLLIVDYPALHPRANSRAIFLDATDILFIPKGTPTAIFIFEDSLLQSSTIRNRAHSVQLRAYELVKGLEEILAMPASLVRL